MGNLSLEFTLSFLLFVALDLEAAVLQQNFVISFWKMNWTDARKYCQQHYTDLVTWNTVDQDLLAAKMEETGVPLVWTGPHRDPANEIATGTTGDDLSSSSWASEQQSSLCAYVKGDLLWYSDLCSSYHHIYCRGTSIKYYCNFVTWNQASQYCNKYNMNLATISNTDTNYVQDSGWIGLYQEADKTWSWVGAQSATYTNWAPGEPSTSLCGCFDAGSENWCNRACSENLNFACHDDNLVVVKENKTWEDALTYCKNMTLTCYDSNLSCVYRFELLSLPFSSDYSYVGDRIYTATTDEVGVGGGGGYTLQTQRVWIGLRFLGGIWWWIDGQVLKNQECPSLQNRCGSLSKNDTDKWIASDCLERKNFICMKYKSYTLT